MRLKLGRPDITRYGERFDVPAARDGVSVTFLGVASTLTEPLTPPAKVDAYKCSQAWSIVVAHTPAPAGMSGRA